LVDNWMMGDHLEKPCAVPQGELGWLSDRTSHHSFSLHEPTECHTVSHLITSKSGLAWYVSFVCHH